MASFEEVYAHLESHVVEMEKGKERFKELAKEISEIDRVPSQRHYDRLARLCDRASEIIGADIGPIAEPFNDAIVDLGVRSGYGDYIPPEDQAR
jgi:hypothetical protein